MNREQLKEIMTEDFKVLEGLGLTNLCLVKKLDSEGILAPSHIIFNYWFDCTFVTLKANRNEDGTYSIGYKDKIFLKKVKPAEFITTLEKYDAHVQLTYGGQVQEIQFFSRKNKKKKKK